MSSLDQKVNQFTHTRWRAIEPLANSRRMSMKHSQLAIAAALSICLLVPNSAAAQLDLTPAGTVSNMAGGDMSVRFNAEGNPHLCEADGVCAQLGAPLVQIDQPTDQGWGWHIKAWNTTDIAPSQMTREDGTPCTDESECQFPEGHLLLVLNDEGAILTGRYGAGEGAPLIDSVELKVLPTGRGMLSLISRASCGGECVWWSWELQSIIQSRAGYFLYAAAVSARGGVQDAHSRPTSDTGWEVCTMIRRGDVTFNSDNTSATAVGGFELMEDTGEQRVYSYSADTQEWNLSSTTPAPSPELVTNCQPLEE